MNYQKFLKGKQLIVPSAGIEISKTDIHPLMFPFQRDLIQWAVQKGRAAIFADCGLGKTHIQTEWARLIGQKTLIIAPLSVARQTVRESLKVDTNIQYVRSQTEVDALKSERLFITNYEMIEQFDPAAFGAVVLDESSILKSQAGKTRRKLTEMFSQTPYRLCCTATPAPNDYIELGNHTEFLGICKRSEMLAMFFINANREHTYFMGGKSYRKKGSNKGGQEWRLKRHSEDAFFRWLASWAVALIKPSDLGYSDNGFTLPPLQIHPHFIRSDYKPDNQLFFTGIKGIGQASQIRRATAPARLVTLEGLMNGTGEQWVVWCGLNDESRMVTEALDGAVEVKGTDSIESKSRAFEDFQAGKHRILVTKPKIGGMGMNFQNAHKMAFFGLSWSWEQYYQCIRREWRYMQERPVDVHIIMSDIEDKIYADILRKDAMAQRLREGLVAQIGKHMKGDMNMQSTQEFSYEQATIAGDGWTAMLGDSCERLKELAEGSIDLSVYSPPFADLYTYTDTERDLGNCNDWTEFFDHYAYIIREVLRVTKPGRITAVHTSDIPAMSQKDGYIGAKDFPGEVIKAYEQEGWIFKGRAFVSKNPQAQAIRTHSQALLFVQLNKDSAKSRPALVDQILIFAKPGDNEIPVTPVKNGEMDNELWIEWANGIWAGISESDTLQFSRARDTGDEKHVCPLQLGTIERCIKLWSNPGETVLSPFMGIGSECYQAIRFGRKAIGIELKQSYFNQAVKNLNRAEVEFRSQSLFAWTDKQVAGQAI